MANLHATNGRGMSCSGMRCRNPHTERSPRRTFAPSSQKNGKSFASIRGRVFNMAIYRIGSRRPIVHPGAYVFEHAVIMGDVELEEGASVWPGAVIRGDNEKIVIRR